jgi:D-alanine-D-alanine ligase
MEPAGAVASKRAGRTVDRENSRDYGAKYSQGGSKHALPGPTLPFVYQEVRRLTLAAHVALGCRGVRRAEFRCDGRVEGTDGLLKAPARHHRDVTCARTRSVCGHNIDELVQWMVEDASPDRWDR